MLSWDALLGGSSKIRIFHDNYPDFDGFYYRWANC